MTHKIYEQDDVKKMNLSYFCRGCKQTVMGQAVTEPQYPSRSDDTECWLICRCPTHLCDLTFVIYDRLNSRVRRTYPFSGFDASDYHQSIPENIREDLAEADRCFAADAYKGAMVLLRRVVQDIVLDRIEDPIIRNKNLWEQIDELSNNGLITKYLKETAHEIRHFGNFGAHPNDDSLNKTTSEEVEIVDSLTRDLIRAIYITPFNTDKLKNKRNK